jgi:hypothetical protein
MKLALPLLLAAVVACSPRESPPAATTPKRPPPVVTTTARSVPVVPQHANGAPPDAQSCIPAKGLLCPQDQGPSDPSFAAYRTKLLAAVHARDTAALTALLDPHIRTSFGAGGGVAGFRKQWQLEHPEASPLWSELEWVLTHGGTFTAGSDGTAFAAPYVYSTFPDQYDAFESAAVTKGNVGLRDTPAATGKVVAEADYAIVTLLDPNRDPATPWRKVRTADGVAGWVESSVLRSPIDYRALFNKKDGRWAMTAFVAGD